MGDEMALVLEMLRSLEARVARLERPAGTGAERTRRYRQRMRDTGVTRSVTSERKGVTRSVTPSRTRALKDSPLKGRDIPQPSTTSAPVVRPGAARDRAMANEVFAFWREERHKNANTILDAKRERLVLARIKDYGIEDVKDAIRGVALSPHHRGDNAEGKVWDDLDLICRDATHFEMFRDLWQNNGKPPALDDTPTINPRTGLPSFLITSDGRRHTDPDMIEALLQQKAWQAAQGQDNLPQPEGVTL